MERRNFIKKSTVAATAAATSPFYFHILKASPAAKGPIIGHGDFRYRVHKEWGVQDPTKIPVLDCHEMVQTKDGRLFMLTSEKKNNNIIYNKSGKVLDTWTLGVFGHGLTLSTEGDEEFLFITSLDTKAVYKTTLDGKVLMTLKYPKETGLYLKELQYLPTETAIAPNGDIFVIDGYGLQYIIKYDSKGNLIKVFGGMGWGDDMMGSRWTSHGVCMDYREDPNNPTLIVTQRNENLFKWFDLEGNFIKQVHLPGAFLSRAVIDDDNLYTAVLNSEEPWSASYSGFVSILNKDNQLISNPGGTKPEYVDGKLKKVKQGKKVFMHPHDVCIDEDKNLYVCQWNSKKTYPIKLERV